MVADDIRRRGVLGAVTAGVVGLAGCESLLSEDRTDDVSGSEEEPTAESRSPSPAAATIDEFRQPASYLIYKRNGETLALNGKSQSEEFSGSVASNVIQAAVDAVDGGRIFITDGEYEVGPDGISLGSNVTLSGAGRGATVLRLQNDINGRKGEKSSTVLRVGQHVENVTIQDIEIDGNESGNRDVPPFPDSPHHHGIVIQGNEPVVPESAKPANVSVQNVSVHDTVRSNIVLAGRNCELENLWLSNSATDHWLYMSGATNCHVRGVHACGFARTSGIVLGVGERSAYDNILSDVTISNLEQTPYSNGGGQGFGTSFPVHAITMRKSGGNAYDNTIRDIRIRIQDAESGASIHTAQPGTRIQNLTYRGPVGVGGIVKVNPAASGTTIAGADIELTDNGRYGMRGILDLHAPEMNILDSRLKSKGVGNFAGIHLEEGPRALARSALQNLRIAAEGPSIRVKPGEFGVPDLVVDGVFDQSGVGPVGMEQIEPVKLDIY